MWQKVGNRIIRQGTKFWSTLKFRPSPKEIETILEMTGGAEVYICREYKNILIFRDNEFVETGPFFYPDRDMPNFATDRDAEYIYWMVQLGEFSVDELAERMFPELYLRGEAYRVIDQHDVWAPSEEECLDLARGASVEAYDFTKLARIRTGNFVYVKAKNEGWVEPTQYGKWKYCGRRK